MLHHARPAALALLVALTMAVAPVRADDVPTKMVEIYRVAPGQHEAFLRMIAQFDEASVEAGIPPRDLYVHQDGANWDFMLIQNAEYTPEQSAKLRVAMKKRNLPGGAHFFIEFRKLLAEHTDTTVEGPTTAAAWLKKLEP
jgi:membrane-bound lytic murein transglycosylase B